ncbi:MAG: cupin domain-containing protein [Planctomycetes bacterium]|nr:cupin domain-containing protein [Planctomycetota bacterium]
MSDSRALVRNWRAQQPYVSHFSAVIWPFFRPRDAAEVKPQEMPVLLQMAGFVKHALQGRQHSDYHRHEDLEQMYYILGGTGEVLLGETRHPVREGDVVYIPPKLPHQMFNENNEAWIELLILSCKVGRFESRPIVRNWRDAVPTVGDDPLLSWRILESVDAAGTSTERGRLLGLSVVEVLALQPGTQALARHYDNEEYIGYVLEGRGRLRLPDATLPLREGDAIFLPAGTSHQWIQDRPLEEWLRLVSIRAAIVQKPPSQGG